MLIFLHLGCRLVADIWHLKNSCYFCSKPRLMGEICERQDAKPDHSQGKKCILPAWGPGPSHNPPTFRHIWVKCKIHTFKSRLSLIFQAQRDLAFLISSPWHFYLCIYFPPFPVYQLRKHTSNGSVTARPLRGTSPTADQWYWTAGETRVSFDKSCVVSQLNKTHVCKYYIFMRLRCLSVVTPAIALMLSGEEAAKAQQEKPFVAGLIPAYRIRQDAEP